MPHSKPAILLFLALTSLFLPACTPSRSDRIRSHADAVTAKLESERNRTLAADLPASSQRVIIDHLSQLRLALSAARVSLIGIPVYLKDPAHQEVGYAVLDEAIGVIDWNIPLHQHASGSPSNATAELGSFRPYPSLFNPKAGLDFSAIQAGATLTTPPRTLPGGLPTTPGIAR